MIPNERILCPHTEGEKRELLFCWQSQTFDVLVPKKRGRGFLKVPWWHHADDKLSDIEMALQCDICGLDGYLGIDCGLKIACYEGSRAEFAAKAMGLLSKHYGLPYREISRKEFFKILKAPELPEIERGEQGLARLNPKSDVLESPNESGEVKKEIEDKCPECGWFGGQHNASCHYECKRERK